MQGHTLHLLMADDDPDDLEMLVEHLIRLHPSLIIKCLGSGYELLDFLSRSDSNELPRILLLDYSMPLLNGAEVLEALAQIPRYHAIQKIIWSTSDNQDYVHKCMIHGADRYFRKPSSLAELRTIGGYITEALHA